MFVSPSSKIRMLKPNSQCDSIWKWGLWDVIRSERWSPQRISALITEIPEWGIWVAQLVDCLTLDFSSGHDLRVVGLSLLKILSLSSFSLAQKKKKKILESSQYFLFCHVRTQWENSCLWTRKEALTRHIEYASGLILDFLASRTVRNTYLFFEPPGLWYFCYSSLNRLRHIY